MKTMKPLLMLSLMNMLFNSYNALKKLVVSFFNFSSSFSDFFSSLLQYKIAIEMNG